VLARPLERQRGKGVDGRLDLGDPPLGGLDHFERRDFVALEAGDRLDRGQPYERVGCVGHGWFLAAITALAVVGSLCVLIACTNPGPMGNRVFRIEQ
jgi:hypothetical protein